MAVTSLSVQNSFLLMWNENHSFFKERFVCRIFIFNKWDFSKFRTKLSRKISSHPFQTMATSIEITVLEHSQVSPPPGSVADESFPLSFDDILWLPSHPIHQLCFYEYSHPKSHFIETVIPNLKNSLSIALQHFFPFTGNLILFPSKDPNVVPRKPEICYVEGDSVSLTMTECTTDFGYLTGNHARKADEFHPLVPKLGDITRDSDTIKVPLLAIQVTLFPNCGICIGITNHHSACDGNGRVNFLKAWASVTKFGDDKQFLAGGTLPFLDRSVIKDSIANLWSYMAERAIQEPKPPHLSGNEDKVRGSFIMTRDQIKKLKKSILAQRPTVARLSAFTIVCAHVWTCLTKVRNAIGEQNNDDDVPEEFGWVADTRAGRDPPVPPNYFGNCLTFCKAKANRSQLVGEEGFFNGVELIGEVIHEMFKSKDSISGEAYLKKFGPSSATAITVAGSPKFNIYATDFGWGKPKKCESVSTDYGQVFSLSTSKESNEDIEIGLSLPKTKMDVFEFIFINELKRVLD